MTRWLYGNDFEVYHCASVHKWKLSTLVEYAVHNNIYDVTAENIADTIDIALSFDD